MHVEESCVAVVGRRRGPFRPHPVGVHWLDGDVPRDAILREGRVHLLAPLPVVVRTLSAGQLLTQRADFAIAHVPLPCHRCLSLPWPVMRLLMITAVGE